MSLSSYHSMAGGFDLKTRQQAVTRCVRDLRGVTFDALAVRGVSGLILAPIVAYLLKKHVIVVRKPKNKESSHATVLVESPIAVGKYVIFDDFVNSGATVHEIRKQVQLACPSLVCVGGYVWSINRTFGNTMPDVKSLNKEG